MSAVNDDDLGRVLRDLPRHEASSSFTQDVMARLSEPQTGRATPARPVWGLALAASALLGVWLVADVARDRAAESRAAQRLHELRNEYQNLQEELGKLRQLTEDLQPVVELGGTDEVDFVLDLRELNPTRPSGGSTQPVSHSSRDR